MSGETHGHDGFTKVPKETLIRITRIDVLREVREMVATKRVRVGNTLNTVFEIVKDIDALIAKEEAR